MQKCPRCGFRKTQQKTVVDDDDPDKVLGSVVVCDNCGVIEENLHGE